MDYNYEEDLASRVQQALEKMKEGIGRRPHRGTLKQGWFERGVVSKIQSAIDMIANGSSVESAVEFYLEEQ